MLGIDAVDYWNLVSVTRPNGWGQHNHPDYGQSHYCLRHYAEKHGEDRFHAALETLFSHNKG